MGIAKLHRDDLNGKNELQRLRGGQRAQRRPLLTSCIISRFVGEKTKKKNFVNDHKRA